MEYTFTETNLKLTELHVFVCINFFLSNPSQAINVPVLINSNLALCFMYSALELICY